MTETEELLKKALKELSNNYEKNITDLVKELEDLKQENALIQQMYKETTEQNKQISEQLTELRSRLK